MILQHQSTKAVCSRPRLNNILSSVEKSANLLKQAKESLVTEIKESLNLANKENTIAKKKRIKRPFGEALTEQDILKQLKEDEEAKNLKKVKVKRCSTSKKAPKKVSKSANKATKPHLDDDKQCF